MLRPPSILSSACEATTINDLPGELLLNIGAQFTNLNRNRDLANLALASKRWRPIAQEWLLIEPRFNLTFIDGYMWEMGHRSHLLSRVKRLEIWSRSEGRTTKTMYVSRTGVNVYLTDVAYTPTATPDRTRQEAEFMEICETQIQHYATNKRHAEDWIRALETDIVPALFGVLLCVLPNLRELKVGDAWLMDFPFFANMRSPSAIANPPHPWSWKHNFLSGALTAILPHLTVLEVPSDMTTLMCDHSMATLFDFRRFETLREVTLTMKAIEGHSILRIGTPPADPREIFTKTLETLRINEATHITANFLNELCLAKKTFFFPSLKRVEAYHIEHLEDTRARADIAQCLDPIDDVRAMFRDAEVAVYLYFPPWTMTTWDSEGGTPWRMKTEPDELHRGECTCYQKAMGPFGVPQEPMDRFEVEWDAEGDAVMV
ncbi:hypothetical protein G6011_08518 [Alternaria panax]|uniref:F-box domain-containing protein n=1 Tax=Alternaria panax TaxID=48097 RepID=A0AAD4FJB5_9PLEO|nr:hypothetical protein G6011_08518 [Alternaria panax]